MYDHIEFEKMKALKCINFLKTLQCDRLKYIHNDIFQFRFLLYDAAHWTYCAMTIQFQTSYKCWCCCCCWSEMAKPLNINLYRILEMFILYTLVFKLKTKCFGGYNLLKLDLFRLATNGINKQARARTHCLWIKYKPYCVWLY